MRLSLHACLLMAALAGFGLLSCDTSDDATPAVMGTGLPGTWQLTKLECECLPSVPAETAEFTDSTFAVYGGNGQLTARGSYVAVPGIITCGLSNNSTPGLRFTEKLTAPFFRHDAQVSVQGNTLVLDYGLPCDAPRKTYRRIR
ncbi:hypothetical protein MUN81_17295 [Hymenobacter sp. 5317J-9]|uniref:hypothetical protein n=1 Tax=Hymenobacter sp. 5317J-9 TaxID=2932250 RepID=UPI001FD71917|nr:hypothetical protein [Hymenobacter sp. 5317J-9]UOQ96984.1 hypothetical protein MUN81_17295 [Hymenobacter sp. 5317J-9]